jgi:hypothetical protein
MPQSQGSQAEHARTFFLIECADFKAARQPYAPCYKPADYAPLSHRHSFSQEHATSAAASSLQQQRLGAANGAAARSAAGPAAAGAGSGIHVVSDNDLFKPKTPQRQGAKQQQQKKVRRLACVFYQASSTVVLCVVVTPLSCA